MGGTIDMRGVVVVCLAALMLLVPARAARAQDVAGAVAGAALAAVADAAASGVPAADSAAMAAMADPPAPAPIAAADVAVAPPTPAPATPAPAARPVAAAPAVAPAPAPPDVNVSVRIGSPGNAGPVTQTSPGGSVNVDVRIGSPGVTGAVTQTTPTSTPTVSAPTPAVSAPTPSGPTVLVWHWTWTSACGVAAPAAAPSAAVVLDWQWTCDGSSGPAMDIPVADPPFPAAAGVPGGAAVAVPAPAARVGGAAPADRGRHVRRGRTRAHGGVVVRPAPPPAAAYAPAVPSSLVAVSVPLARDRPEPRSNRRRSHPPVPISPEVPQQPLTLIAASAAPGGSPATSIFFFALALLGAEALFGPAGPMLRISSVARRTPRPEGRRLERPG